MLINQYSYQQKMFSHVHDASDSPLVIVPNHGVIRGYLENKLTHPFCYTIHKCVTHVV